MDLKLNSYNCINLLFNIFTKEVLMPKKEMRTVAKKTVIKKRFVKKLSKSFSKKIADAVEEKEMKNELILSNRMIGTNRFGTDS